jgi:hypothetical protein
VPLIGDEHAELIPPRSERAAQVPVPIAPAAPTAPVSDAKVDAA